MTARKPSTPASRSESVRSRRSQRSQERVKRASENVRYQAATPAVLSRRGGMGTPVMSRANNPVRRPVIIPLRKAGAEVELPAVPVVRPGWRLLSGFLVLLFGALIVAAFITPWLRIIQPEFTGLTRVAPADVSAVLNLTNEPIFLVNPAEMANAVQAAFPELTDIQIDVNLPAQVMLTVAERQPIIAWSNNGQITWLDKEGVVFQPRGDAPPLLTIDGGELPVIQPETEDAEEGAAAIEKSGEASLRRVETSLLNTALKLSEILPAETALAYNQEEGLGWTSPDGWQVFVGASLNDMTDKLSMYQSIMDQLNQQGITPSMVSVQFLHAPFYRVE